jgi:hypothetical protein
VEWNQQQSASAFTRIPKVKPRLPKVKPKIGGVNPSQITPGINLVATWNRDRFFLRPHDRIAVIVVATNIADWGVTMILVATTNPATITPRAPTPAVWQ